MSMDLNKSYDFKEVENQVIKEFSQMEINPQFAQNTFSIAVPPPNVTGSLHMGHALNCTIQDFLIRYNLLLGKDSVWFVGTDHAGIATQTVVEKNLLKQGIRRSDITPEEFLSKIWEWKEQYGSIILDQFQRLGIYANIKSARFTMDPEYTKAVKKAFVELYKKGYVYKGKRVVNWCPRCLTSLSDLEVVHKPTPTKLYYVKYKLNDGYIIICTTRPETILADTAIAVNPNDKRYSSLIGNYAEVPIVKRLVPIISDQEVDMEFGTGALKVTPAHDFNDFKIYQKNQQIDIINIFNTKAQLVIDKIINEHNKEILESYQGLDRYQAREKIIKDLTEQNLLHKIEDYTTNIGYCYRCDTVIEPYYSDQWFISMKELVRKPKEVVENDQIRFFPSTYKKVVIDWYENIQDWCVSRQILWGHRIPVYYCKDCGYEDASEEELRVCPKCGKNLEQEKDVLDTWFSSALWPFAVMYWPLDKFQKYQQNYYPTNVLTTAREIVFLWVSRMIVMSMFFLNQIPFKDVIIHAVILAPSGKRMSKSLGTGIDPLELIEKYGADALRMGLIIQTAESQDVKFSYEKIEMARNFINKIWNSIRYFQIRKTNPNAKSKLSFQTIELINLWLYLNLYELVNKLDQLANNYKFFDYCMSLYQFVWNVFCDWYIEFTKFMDYSDFEKTVQDALRIILLYLHPLTPFSTYFLYQKIFQKNIMQEKIQNAKDAIQEQIQNIENEGIKCSKIDDLIESIKQIRPFINEIINLTAKQNVTVHYQSFDDQIDHRDLIFLFNTFTKTVHNAVNDHKIDEQLSNYFVINTKIGSIKIFVEKEYISKFREFVDQKIRKLEENVNKIQKLLNNSEFILKADRQVVDNYREQLQNYLQMIEINKTILDQI
ncbi:MAG: valine--tRNA ligase [bacterium]